MTSTMMCVSVSWTVCLLCVLNCVSWTSCNENGTSKSRRLSLSALVWYSVCTCTWLLVLDSSTSDGHGGGDVLLPKSDTAEWEKRALINLTIVVGLVFM